METSGGIGIKRILSGDYFSTITLAGFCMVEDCVTEYQPAMLTPQLRVNLFSMTNRIAVRNLATRCAPEANQRMDTFLIFGRTA